MKQTSFILLTLFGLGTYAQNKIILYDNAEFKPVIEWGGPRSHWQYFQGNTKPNGNGPLNSGTSTVNVTDSFVRNGYSSYRIRIQKDQSFGKTGLDGTTRSELTWNIGANGVPTGVRWVAASILIPAWYVNDPLPEGVLFNTYAVPNNYEPGSLKIINGKWFFEGVNVSDSGKVSGKFSYDLGVVEKGVWIDWVLNRNFTQKDSGFIKLWKNGKLVVNHKGGNWIQVAHEPEMYMGIGIHKWPWEDSVWSAAGTKINERVFYYDEIRFGNTSATYNDFIVVPDSLTNKKPIVSAGPDQVFNLPKNFATLTGVASDSDGQVASIKWTQLSGDSSAKIVNASDKGTTVNNLKVGVYKFRLTVKDNTGAMVADDIQITVKAALPGAAKDIFFYDDCEDEPEVQPVTEWSQLPLSRWGFFTANGNDVTDKSALANVTVSSLYARKGKKSYKFSVTKDPTYDPPSMRAELSWNVPATKPIGYKWMAASLFIPTTWVDDCTPTGLLFNTKASPDNYISPFGIHVIKNRMYVSVANITKDGKVLGSIDTDIGPLEKGVWTDWAVNRNFTQTDTGYIRLYKNGKLIWERIGPNWLTGNGRAAEAYIHQGLYKWPWGDSTGAGWGKPCFNGTIEAYYDEFRFGGPSATLSDFQTPDSTQSQLDSLYRAMGTPVEFDVSSGQISQFPYGVWASSGATTAMSSKQIIETNGFVEMSILNPDEEVGYLALDNDSLNHNVSYSPQNIPDDLIWISVRNKKLFVGDFINGKQTSILTDFAIEDASRIRIKRVGNSFLAQVFTNKTGWLNAYTFEYQSSSRMWVKATFNNASRIHYPLINK